MTVPSTPRSVGPFAGNGVATAFPFAFRVFAPDDIAITRTAPDGSQTTLVLGSDYLVSLNADQNASPGGTITYPVSGPPLPSGWTLAGVGALPYDQPYSPTPGGRFAPTSVENALDRAVIQIQQIAEIGERSVRVPIGESAIELPTIVARSGKLLGFNAVTGAPEAVPPGGGGGGSSTIYADLASSAVGYGAELVGYNGTRAQAAGTVGYGIRQTGLDLASSATGKGAEMVGYDGTRSQTAGTVGYGIRQTGLDLASSATGKGAEMVGYNGARAQAAGTVGYGIRQIGLDLASSAANKGAELVGYDGTRAQAAGTVGYGIRQTGLDLASSATGKGAEMVGYDGTRAQAAGTVGDELRQLGSRAVRVPAGESAVDLPAIAARSGKLLGFNALTGEPEAVAPGGGGASIYLDLASAAPGDGAELVAYDGSRAQVAGTVGDALHQLDAIGARAVLVPAGESAVTIPTIVARSGKLFGFNAATGEPEAVTPGSSAIYTDLASSAAGDGAELVGYDGTRAQAAGTVGYGIRQTGLDLASSAIGKGAELVGYDGTRSQTAGTVGYGIRQIGLDLAANAAGKGAEMVGYDGSRSQAGGTVGYKLRQIGAVTTDYPSTAAAITAAIGGGFVVGVLSDITVQIPTDAATLQIALDRLAPLRPQVTITLNIASGHTLSTGVTLSGRNCSQFRVTSTDAEVPVSSGYNVSCFAGTNGAVLPRIAVLINAANQTSLNGISLNASSVVIESGKGVKNVWGTGLLMQNGSWASADGAVFSGAARNGTTGAGITAWGSRCSAEGANVSGSNYYGVQAAHGGAVSFRQGNANNCYRHGIRATDAAIVDADAATANNCAGDGIGYAVYAYMAGTINFVNGSATGCGGTAALMAFGAGSHINAEGATASATSKNGCYVWRGGTINAVGASITGAIANYVDRNDRGGIQRSDSELSASPVRPLSGIIAGGDISFYPDPSGVTYLRIDTEGGASADDLDTLTPLSPYTLTEGHRVVMRTVSASRDVTVRDAGSSGASGNYVFQTPGGGPITLSNSLQITEFIWVGTGWCMMSYAAN